eukprot:scaffold4978_cov117-Isochrysis_galbana.AAC.6
MHCWRSFPGGPVGVAASEQLRIDREEKAPRNKGILRIQGYEVPCLALVVPFSTRPASVVAVAGRWRLPSLRMLVSALRSRTLALANLSQNTFHDCDLQSQGRLS